LKRVIGIGNLFVLVVSLIGYVSTTVFADDKDATSFSVAPSMRADKPIGLISAPNYRAIVDREGPAVVGITVEGIKAGLGPNGRPSRKARSAGPANPGFPSGEAQPSETGLGSGFIISSDGLVLTNAHVVQGADSVTVTLADRREFKATIVGQDLDTDIAVLRIDGHDLPVAKIGDSEKLKVGDYVLAIGTPYGFEQTATSGIVSAVHRLLPNQPYVPFIQTDAALNPGNSGGPMLDSGGAVVGINAEIYSNTGGYEGLAFAIPINLAKRVADQLIAKGVFRHGLVGVTVQQLTQPLAESFGLKKPDGALISRIKPLSAAAQAGLLPGDVILMCNDKRIRVAGDLSVIIAFAAPEDTIRFVVWRNGAQRSFSATLAAEAADGGTEMVVTSNERLGIQIRALSTEEQKAANVSSAMLIVRSLGAAQKAGIVAGDLLLAVNGVRIEQADQLHGLVEKGGSTIALLIQAEGDRGYVAVHPDD
jgi:serine protease Do